MKKNGWTRVIKHQVVTLLNSLLERRGWTLVPLGRAPNERDLRLGLFRRLSNMGFSPRWVMDVGAHKGDWSRDAHIYFPQAHFTLVEPQEDLKPHLERFVQQHDGSDFVIAGAASSEGQKEFHVIPQSCSASSFAISHEESVSRGFLRRQVRTVTLDSLCQQHGGFPEVLKVDAEGFELEVLRGARSLLGQTELIFLEVPLFFEGDQVGSESPEGVYVRPSFHTLVQTMRESGYEPYDITDMNRRSHDDALYLMEMVFALRNGELRRYKGWGPEIDSAIPH